MTNGKPNPNAPYIYVRLDDTTHDFRITDVVYQDGGIRGLYDRYRCKQCGIEGNRYGISAAITLPNNIVKPPSKICPLGWDDPDFEEDEFTWE